MVAESKLVTTTLVDAQATAFFLNVDIYRIILKVTRRALHYDEYAS